MLLPTGKPVKTGVNSSSLNLHGVLERLCSISLSGYLRFLRQQTAGIVLYENGRLTGAFFQEDGAEKRCHDVDAVERIFDFSLSGGVVLDIFSLSPEAVMAVHSLLRGKMLLEAQDPALMSIETLAAQIEEDQRNGCLRIHAAPKTSLVFYEQGATLGAHLDGSTELEPTIDAALSLATLPEARVDVFETMDLGKIPHQDLMMSNDLAALWLRCVRRKKQQAPSPQGHARTDTPASIAEASALKRQLAAIEEHLGKVIGPIAPIIFNEKQEAWMAQGEASPRRLADLIHLLEGEIEDAERIEKFRNLVANVLIG